MDFGPKNKSKMVPGWVLTKADLMSSFLATCQVEMKRRRRFRGNPTFVSQIELTVFQFSLHGDACGDFIAHLFRISSEYLLSSLLSSLPNLSWISPLISPESLLSSLLNPSRIPHESNPSLSPTSFSAAFNQKGICSSVVVYLVPPDVGFDDSLLWWFVR